jgi:hypothetical protein
MSNVHAIRPLESIPTMLRRWADMFEAGDTEMPKSVLMVCVPKDEQATPSVYMAGREGSRAEEIGALFTAARIASETEVAP